MPIRTVVAPALAASLVALAGHCFAGDTPMVFHWLLPQDGAWGTADAWDQGAIPGRGAFVGADVVIDAPGGPFTVSLSAPDFGPAFDVGNVTLGAEARLNAAEFARPNGVFRSLSMLGSNQFDISHQVNITENLIISAHSSTRMLRESLNIGGDITNDGVMQFEDGIMRAASVLNRGRIESVTQDAFDFTEIVFSGTLINEGFILASTPRFAVEGDIIHRGIVEVTTGASLTLTGNQTFEAGSKLRGNGRLRFFGTPSTDKVIDGALDHAGAILFENGGFWTITGSTSAASFTTSDTMDGFAFGGAFRSAGLVDLSARSFVFHGDAQFESDAAFLGGPLVFEGSYSFARSLTLDAIVAHFEHGITVGGNLSISGVSTVTAGAGAIFSAPNGNLAWSLPNADLDVELIAGGEIIIGARRLNAAMSARRIRLGAGYSELNTDLTPERDVLIAGTSLSIGAVGEIAHRTIHGDLTTTYAPSQGWDFDILGSGARGAEESDTLVIEGDASIYGILRVHTIGDASALRAGDEFTLFTAESIDALFRFVSLPTLADGMSFDLVYESSESSVIRLVVVPAPGAALALGIAGLAPIARRRRRPRSRRWLLAES